MFRRQRDISNIGSCNWNKGILYEVFPDTVLEVQYTLYFITENEKNEKKIGVGNKKNIWSLNVII